MCNPSWSNLDHFHSFVHWFNAMALEKTTIDEVTFLSFLLYTFLVILPCAVVQWLNQSNWIWFEQTLSICSSSKTLVLKILSTDQNEREATWHLYWSNQPIEFDRFRPCPYVSVCHPYLMCNRVWLSFNSPRRHLYVDGDGHADRWSIVNVALWEQMCRHVTSMLVIYSPSSLPAS